jgi:tetratricopeptide (TPR) repeat protein
MARSRYATDYTDLAEANRILAAARAAAPGNTGPLLSQAVLGMMSHRLGATEQALGIIDTWAVQPDPGDMAEIDGLRGDLAFYRGDMAGAGALYAKAGAEAGGAAVAYRRANLAKARGEYDAAIQHLLRSATGSPRETPFQHAGTALQIGSVEQARGNYAAARKWFAVADEQFPGYWLFEAHRAQAKAIAGDLSGGIALMRRVAEAHPAAEVMDALAMLLRTSGEATESRAWAARAGAEWDRRLALAPEAAYGHALEHELVFGTPDRAIDLARKNLAARPYGEARVMLATALVMGGRYDPALAELDRAEASGWRSAPLYALKTQIFELTGRKADADKAREAALALNPRIFSPETALVWFGHG